MSISAVRYAGPHARVRAMISQLLTSEEKQDLIASSNVDDVVQRLRSTPYVAELAALTQSGADLLAVERAFERNLIDAYDHIIRTLGSSPRTLVVEMLRRFELDNLKTILSSLVTGDGGEEVRSRLTPLSRYSRLPVDNLLAARSVADVIKALGLLRYATVLQRAYERYVLERSLFPLQVALDLYYHRQLWSRVEALSSADKAIAARLMGKRYDVINVGWIARYKVAYRLSAEEVFNYTLPHGYMITSEVIHRAGQAADLPKMIAELPAPYRQVLQPVAKDREDLWRVEVVLNQHLWREANTALAGYPFRIGIVLAYLFLKEAEIHDLKVIMEGRYYGRTAREIETLLWGQL